MIPGWYGKIPATGDFVARRMPASFSETWERWLQAALAASRQRLGAGWQESYLSMPAWRFVLGPGVAKPNAWAGLMLPSVDAVGRCFPLTIAAALPSAGLDVAATLFAAAPWFAAIEAIALRAIGPRAALAQIDAEVRQHSFPAEYIRPAGALQAAESRSMWLAEECDVLGRTLLECEGLPDPQQYCAMMGA
jgi:type VI secretion system protein ImpM